MPSDQQWRGACSAQFLAHAVKLAREAGYEIGNVDLTLVCEAPKIGPHRPAMRRRIAEILGVEESAVWLKAKTGESVGPIGEELAIGAECVVLLERA